MNDILFLASDYVERMANPVYGTVTNEDYALKLATLLRREGFEARLNEEIRGLTDPGTFTSHGWLWLFGWARSRNIVMKDDLLAALYEEWSSVFVKAAIVDLATQRADYHSRPDVDVSVEKFPNRFLSSIMSQATGRPEAERMRHPEQGDWQPGAEEGGIETEPSISSAENTLIALLQVGRPITIDAARVLLRHKWEGQEQLLQSFWAVYEALDPETRDVWRQFLNPPQRI